MEQKKRSKLVIEDNTIYEIDLDCYQCLEKEKENELKGQLREYENQRSPKRHF